MNGKLDIRKLLEELIQARGSDLHLSVNSPPRVRVDQQLVPLKYDAMTPEDCRALAYSILTDKQQKRLELEFEVDFAFGIEGLSRFRGNIFFQRGSLTTVIRAIPFQIPPMEQLRLPRICQTFPTKPKGLVLVTGPTGSGKSTSLAAIIDRINAERPVHIITIEDPVEYELAGINQCGVNVKAGMTFAAGLRAMMRQDPDVIMVGEMRDKETATIGMEAALTGHLVLSTLHTNDAPSATTRLADMEVEPFLISSAVIGVLAQRLVRQICSHCKESYTTQRESLLRYGFPLPDEIGADTGGEITLFKGKGCDHCKGSGYKGRTGIHELLMMSDEIRDEILKRGPAHLIRNLAVQTGMKTLQMDAVSKILMGVTSVDEVLRVLYA